MTEERSASISRRRLLTMIGTAAGSSAMYQAMTALGLAAESTYEGPIRLEGDPNGASILVLLTYVLPKFSSLFTDLGKTRAHLFGVPPHARKIALRERPAWFDLRQAPRHNFAWFIWDWQHAGPVAIAYVS